jgi:hypothetical protein
VLYLRNKARYDYHAKITLDEANEALELAREMIDLLKEQG